MKKSKVFLFYWLPLIAYCILIFFQSSNAAPSEIPDIPYMDKVLHLIGYAVLGVLFYRALGTLSIRNHTRWWIILSILASTLYGVSDEIHQSYIPERSAEFADVIADMIGSAMGVYVYPLLMVRFNARFNVQV